MAQTNTSIRRATADDAGLLAQLGARTFFDTFADSTKPDDMAAYLSEAFGEGLQSAELADAASTFFVAETDGAASGYAKLHAGEVEACVAGLKPVELARLYVLREWLGRGVGEALMRACVEEARRAGHLTMWLGVWEHNARALAFYRRWGFHVVGEHVFRVGSDPQTDLIMERALV
ncbi:MAG TPA: GNAT family N-acetyltransferase [Pyrinomonadaceae bacterium]|jgi:GNAT superfamily N-acetyltransferase|nr:GNAT family N-acetyltransferase [Pyrinomonadaceae bacterium]